MRKSVNNLDVHWATAMLNKIKLNFLRHWQHSTKNQVSWESYNSAFKIYRNLFMENSVVQVVSDASLQHHDNPTTLARSSLRGKR
jgi:hypothetical protein